MSAEVYVLSPSNRDVVLRRAQKGDPEALNLLFASCRTKLFHCASHILRRPQDAEDAVQQAMLAAYKNLHQFKRRSQFSTWMVRIVINAALMQIRKERSRPAIPLDQPSSEAATSSIADAVPDASPNPEQIYSQEERDRTLAQALLRLPPKYQAVIRLRYMESQSTIESARSLGVPRSTLKAQLHRARRLLMKNLSRGGHLRRGQAELSRRVRPIPVRNADLCAA